MKNILEKIVTQKKEDLKVIKEKVSLASIDNKIKYMNNFIDFKKTLTDREKKNQVSLIAEIKKASPSAGVIIKDFDPVKIANLYFDSKATCLSVLTEEKFFLGNLDYITDIKKKLIYLF